MTPYSPSDYAPDLQPAPVHRATGEQKQAIVRALAQLDQRTLTTAVLLGINRLTEAQAHELLHGGLEKKRAEITQRLTARVVPC